MSQWTGCRGEERHGGDRGCGGCRNGQDVVVKRDMEVTEVVEDGRNGQDVVVKRDMEVTEVVEDVAMDRMSW